MANPIHVSAVFVAPCAGAWIETPLTLMLLEE